MSLAPEIIYTSGTRHIYLAGQNFNLLKNKSDYDIKIKALDGSPDKVVSSENFILDTDKNTADVILDFDMNVGTYQIVFDMKDAAKKDITSESLKFNVSDDVSYRGGSYGIVTVEKAGNNKYALMAYKDENEYSQKRPDAQNIALLELRGDFSLKYENGKLVEAEAVSLETFDDEASAADTIPAPIATHDVRQETPEEKRPTCPAATDGPLGEPFDLRRAVIYSEILKPKFEE